MAVDFLQAGDEGEIILVLTLAGKPRPAAGRGEDIGLSRSLDALAALTPAAR